MGCSGWFYWHWRGLFYPETERTDTWFKHYTANFRTVELNAPFYKWPNLATAKSWRRNAPDDFRYSVKVNRLITHEMRLVHTRMLIEEFYRFAEILGPKLGCFLFQFPPSYTYTPSRLQSIVRQLDPQFCNAVEFRHKSWWRESVYRRFEERGLAFCTVSAPRCRKSSSNQATSSMRDCMAGAAGIGTIIPTMNWRNGRQRFATAAPRKRGFILITIAMLLRSRTRANSSASCAK